VNGTGRTAVDDMKEEKEPPRSRRSARPVLLGVAVALAVSAVALFLISNISYTGVLSAEEDVVEGRVGQGDVVGMLGGVQQGREEAALDPRYDLLVSRYDGMHVFTMGDRTLCVSNDDPGVEPGDMVVLEGELLEVYVPGNTEGYPIHVVEVEEARVLGAKDGGMINANLTFALLFTSFILTFASTGTLLGEGLKPLGAEEEAALTAADPGIAEEMRSRKGLLMILTGMLLASGSGMLAFAMISFMTTFTDGFHLFERAYLSAGTALLLSTVFIALAMFSGKRYNIHVRRVQFLERLQ